MYQILLSLKTHKSLNLVCKLIAALFLVVCFSAAYSQCPHTLPFTEDFATNPLGTCSGTHGGWTSTTVASGAGWNISNTNYAGGVSPEAEGYGNQANGGVSETIRLISPSLNTTGVSSVTLSFKHRLYLTNSGASGSGTITIIVESSPDNSIWTQQHSAGFNATPSLQSVLNETRTITVNGLSSNTFYFRFSVSGVLFKLWGWEIDDVNITGTIAPVPTITNFSPTNACSGSGTTVTINGTNFLGASAVNFNGTPASFSITSATEISAVLPAGATTGVITVVTGGGTATSVTNFTVNPTPVAIATPDVQSSCSGNLVNIALSSNVGGTTYTWSRTTPANISGTLPVNGTTDPSGTLINSTASAIIVNFSITPTAGNCTGNAVSANVVVQPLPSTPGSITGPASVCSGSANTYSIATVSGATSYIWTLPNGWSGTSTTSTINTTAGSTGGTISVTADNACGSSTPQTLAVSISSSTPTLGAISGSASVCSGSANTYSVVDMGATSYTWTLPNGWSGTSTTSSINTTAGSSGGTISVTANNSCGSSSPETLTVSIETAPATPGTIIGPNSICTGSTNSYSVTTVSGATGYTWTIPNGWVGNSTSESISATSDATGGSISITADNSCGSSGAQTVNVTVNPLPNVTFDFTQNPVCQSASPVTLFGSPAGGIFSGQGVSGTLFDPAALNTGSYVVTYDYSDGNSCSATDTSTIDVTICTGTEKVNVSEVIEVYPNPLQSGNWNLVCGADLMGSKIEIFDNTGRLVYQSEVKNQKSEIELSTAGGIYLIRISTEQKSWSLKLMKL